MSKINTGISDLFFNFAPATDSWNEETEDYDAGEIKAAAVDFITMVQWFAPEAIKDISADDLVSDFMQRL